MIFMSIKKKEQKIKQETELKLTKVNKIIIFIIAIIILIMLFSSFYYYMVYNNNVNKLSFTHFKNNFNSANTIAISVNYNSLEFSYEMGCASSLIYNIVSITHRNPNTINFFVLNNTKCVYIKNGLGHLIKNYTNSTATNCLNQMKRQPTIFINYSPINKTIIKSNKIYVSGNINFLKECGIASQIK